MAETRPRRWKSWIASRRVGWMAVGIAVILNLPSVPTGWYMDDLVHRAQFLEIHALTDGSNMTHRMYDFLSGVPEEILAYKDLGVLPWWADDELRIRLSTGQALGVVAEDCTGQARRWLLSGRSCGRCP